MRRRGTIISLVCLGLLFALAGARAAAVDMGPADLLIAVTTCCGMALVCVHDARRMGKPMACVAGLALVVAWPVAIPVYLVWSRGWKRGLLGALAFMTAVAVLHMGTFYATGYAVWGMSFFAGG